MAQLQVTKRQLSTILAALRYWQRTAIYLGKPRLGETYCRVVADPEGRIATDEGQFTLMSAEEIDILCEYLNCGKRI